MKLMKRDGDWHRLHSATPDGWLVKGITKIMSDEGERVGLRIKVVEEHLTRPDLSALRVKAPPGAC